MDECWHKLSEHLAHDERVKKGWDGENGAGGNLDARGIRRRRGVEEKYRG